MYDRLGRAAVAFAIAYLRRRYRREIRVGIGLTAALVGIGAYLASRNVREG
jgi:hypothetical protein